MFTLVSSSHSSQTLDQLLTMEIMGFRCEGSNGDDSMWPCKKKERRPKDQYNTLDTTSQASARQSHRQEDRPSVRILSA